MATVALSGIITPSNVVTATSTTTLTNKTLTGAVMNGTLGATTPTTVVATTVKASTTMGVGGATPSASGSGISFPATQDASSDANTLDDYEEGTWTPSLSSIGNWTGTPTTVYAKYIKIGKSVFMEFQFNGTVTSSSTTTYFIMTLPITATSTSVSTGSNQAEAFIGTILANATTNCYVWFPASSGLTSGAHNPTCTATYSSAN